MILFPKKCPIYNAGKLFEALTGNIHPKERVNFEDFAPELIPGFPVDKYDYEIDKKEMET